MARKPVNEINALQTRAALWSAIREIKSFTAKQVRDETRCSRSQVEEYIKGLTAAKILERVDGERGRYLLIDDRGVDAPRVRRDGTEVTMGQGRENMWHTMRWMRRFTAVDLQVFAATEEHPIALSEAKHYCRYLCLAGYLINHEGTYSLVRQHGPKSPMIQRIKQVFDPNINEVVWSEHPDETTTGEEQNHDSK